MLVAQSRHLNSNGSSPLATPQNKRAIVKSQQGSPSRSAPRQTGTPTCLSQQKPQTRPNTSAMRPTAAFRKNIVSPSPKHVSPTKAPKGRGVAEQAVIKASQDALEKSKVHYMTNEEVSMCNTLLNARFSLLTNLSCRANHAASVLVLVRLQGRIRQLGVRLASPQQEEWPNQGNQAR